MDRATYHEAIGRETTALAAAVGQSIDAPVPSCPGWTVRDLAGHMGMIQRWVTHVVSTRAAAPVDWDMERWGPPHDGVPAWLEDGAGTLLTALDGIDPDTQVWTFVGMQPASFWSRRQANEVAVHRWDGENAVGDPAPIDPELAADGADEAISTFLPRRHTRAKVQGAGESVHMHRTDGEGEWLIRFEPEGLKVTREHAKGDVALRGSANDLLLWIWNRVPVDRLEVFGDAALLDRWAELVPSI